MKFTFRCTACKHELIYRTDYENDDYVCVEGCRSGKEIWFRNVREENAHEAMLKGKQSNRNGPNYDALAELERKAKEQQRSMDLADSVNELLELQKAHVRPDTDAIIEENRRKRRLVDDLAVDAEFEAHKAKRRRIVDLCRDDGFDWEDGVPKLRGSDMFAEMKKKQAQHGANGIDRTVVNQRKDEKRRKTSKKHKKKKRKKLVNPFQKDELYGDGSL